MWCGPTSCHASVKGRDGCPSGQTCVPLLESHCFVKPCLGFGQCSNFPPPPSRCRPGSCYQDNSCANITFTFNKETVPQVSGPEGFVVALLPLQSELDGSGTPAPPPLPSPRQDRFQDQMIGVEQEHWRGCRHMTPTLATSLTSEGRRGRSSGWGGSHPRRAAPPATAVFFFSRFHGCLRFISSDASRAPPWKTCASS